MRFPTKLHSLIMFDIFKNKHQLLTKREKKTHCQSDTRHRIKDFGRSSGLCRRRMSF